MKKLLVTGASGTSRILVGASIDSLQTIIGRRRTVVISDTAVAGHYRERLPAYPLITIGRGEKIKTLETVTHIYGELVELEADRSTFILGVGGR